LFRSRGMLFALPASLVREVSFRPRIVALPCSAPILAGLCHFRNEFLPVFTLQPLIPGTSTPTAGDSQLIVLMGDEGPWAVLVDEVVSLEPLETAVTTDAAGEESVSDVLLGWATFRDHSVRVLDAETLYATARRVLQESWSSAERSAGTPPDGFAMPPDGLDATSRNRTTPDPTARST